MHVVVGLFRLFLVVLALVGTRAIWRDGDIEGLVYFTNQTGFLIAVVFAWAGVASLLRRRQPPGWLKGGVTLFAAITGLVANLVLAVIVDFLLLDAHRRLRGLDAARWLLYPLAYFAFTTIRGFVSPGSEYPYGFVDLDELGWTGLLVNVVLYGAGFLVLGLVIVGIDRLLPTGPLIGWYADRSPAAASSETAGAAGSPDDAPASR